MWSLIFSRAFMPLALFPRVRTALLLTIPSGQPRVVTARFDVLESSLGLPFSASSPSVNFVPKIFHGIPDVRNSTHTFLSTFGRRVYLSPYVCPYQNNIKQSTTFVAVLIFLNLYVALVEGVCYATAHVPTRIVGQACWLTILPKSFLLRSPLLMLLMILITVLSSLQLSESAPAVQNISSPSLISCASSLKVADHIVGLTWEQKSVVPAGQIQLTSCRVVKSLDRGKKLNKYLSRLCC
jgi:hypothetical protein